MGFVFFMNGSSITFDWISSERQKTHHPLLQQSASINERTRERLILSSPITDGNFHNVKQHTLWWAMGLAVALVSLSLRFNCHGCRVVCYYKLNWAKYSFSVPAWLYFRMSSPVQLTCIFGGKSFLGFGICHQNPHIPTSLFLFIFSIKIVHYLNVSPVLSRKYTKSSWSCIMKSPVLKNTSPFSKTFLSSFFSDSSLFPAYPRNGFIEVTGAINRPVSPANK